MYVVGWEEGAEELLDCWFRLWDCCSFAATTSALIRTAPPPSIPVAEVKTAMPSKFGLTTGSGGTVTCMYCPPRDSIGHCTPES